MKYRNISTNVFRFPFRTFNKIIFTTICLLAFGNFSAFAEDIQQFGGEDSRRLNKQAEKLIKKGEFEEAGKILRRILEANPKESTAKLNLAYVLVKQKSLIEAYELSFEVAKNEPKNSRAFAILGMTMLNAGNFREANLALVNALTLNKKEALAWCGLGMLDFYENRINESLKSLNAAVYLDSDNPDYVFAFAQVSTRAENYKDAAEGYRTYLSLSNDSDKERRERIKGLINFLSYLGNKQSLYLVGGKEKTKVKIDLVGNRPIIELKVNGKEEPLRFVLDTGSGISVMSLKTATKLGIKPIARGGFARGIGGDGRFEIVYGFLKSVNIGDVKMRNVPIYIRDFHSKNEKIDGYIGLALISKFLTTLDYGDLSFALERKSSVPQNIVSENVLSLPLRLTSSGFLSGEVQLNGVESSLNFIVDTGASISVISDDLARSSEMENLLQGEKFRVIGAAGVTEDVQSYLLPSITFGTHKRESITAVALDLDLINEASGFQQAGILGGNFLKNYRLTFDFQNSKVIFVPIKK